MYYGSHVNHFHISKLHPESNYQEATLIVNRYRDFTEVLPLRGWHRVVGTLQGVLHEGCSEP